MDFLQNAVLVRPKVLLCPLDWGLGHATRVIPLIRSLGKAGFEVTIAASGSCLPLLQEEFPQLECLPIPGYRIKYHQKRSQFFWKILFQAPRILAAILREHFWLRSALRKYKWDAVISDNRYGLFHSGLRSIIITHQLHIKTGFTGLDPIVYRLHRMLLSRFDEGWIPDMPGLDQLAGSLSHGRIPFHFRYIGPLSRLSPLPEASPGHVVVIISGPEPQRSLFEDILKAALRSHPIRATVVRGLPGDQQHIVSTKEVIWQNHVSAKHMQDLLSQASWVIARSGYSTVMDLVRTGRRAVLVPTPGQTEQEYLAQFLQQQGLFPSIPQEDFRLSDAVSLAAAFPFKQLDLDFDLHQTAIGELFRQISSSKNTQDA